MPYPYGYMTDLISKLIQDLQTYQGKDSFNPWIDFKEGLDESKSASKIRTENLKAYLQMRHNARYILVGEGLSFQGGRFSGIAMTSERQLLNDTDNQIFVGQKRRTSSPLATEKETIRQLGFTENTGSIVWKTLAPLLPTTDWITWNIFPFHPHKPDLSLTNRLPRPDETELGLDLFKQNIKFLGEDRILISVGQTSYQTLSEAGYQTHLVRHPANGGAVKFKEQIEQIIKNQG